MLAAEVWRALPNHPGYEVSSYGQVRSYRSRQGHSQETPRTLSPGLVKGYRSVKLGRSRYARVHQLVLEAFVGPCPPGLMARHLNGHPLDNRASNLRWGTAEENYNDRRAHGTDIAGERNGNARLTEADVLTIRTLRGSGHTIDVIHRNYFPHVSRSAVSHVSAGHTWRHL